MLLTFDQLRPAHRLAFCSGRAQPSRLIQGKAVVLPTALKKEDNRRLCLTQRKNGHKNVVWDTSNLAHDISCAGATLITIHAADVKTAAKPGSAACDR